MRASSTTAPATTISPRRASKTRRRSSSPMAASTSTARRIRLRVATRRPPAAAKATMVPMVPELPSARRGWAKRGSERWKASAAKVRMSASRLRGTFPAASKVSVRRTDPMATL